VISGLVTKLLEGMYDWLAVGQPIRPAELVFVLAGLPERKRYGWELFQRGCAPVMLFSVGRSEARFLKVRAGVPLDGDIVSLLPIPPERGNHIFLWVDQAGAFPEIVRLPELNTCGELWALCNVIQQRPVRHIVFLSTDVHLRRIRYAIGKLLGSTPLQITYVGVPEDGSTCRRHRWWSRRQDARLVIGEWIKLAGYHVKYGIFMWHRRYAYLQLQSAGISG
jgi:hypothetical protein